MEYHATLRSLRQSPRKVRLLADALVGLSVSEADARLSATVQAASTPLRKLVRSAAANALNRDQIDAADLTIRSVRVDGGAVLKRFHPRAFGRAAPIRRRSSHISLQLIARDGAKKVSVSAAPLPAAVPAAAVQAPETQRAVAQPPKPTAGGASADPKVQRKIEPKSARAGFMRRFFQRKSGM